MTDHYTLLPDWRLDVGPMRMHMPDDGPGETYDWIRAANAGTAHAREDSQDCLNANGTWGHLNQDGSNSPDAEGGSGLKYGYARSDIDAVTVAARAKHKNSPRSNREHLIRQYSDDMAGWDMTHQREFATRLLEYADLERSSFGPGGEVVLDKPEWVPDNIAQYHAMALADPHRGSPMNGRAAGWAFFLEAMALKIDPKRSKRYAQMALETCELAAFVGTGQICVSKNTGGGPTDPELVCYAFHQSTLAIGAAALAFQLETSLPYWVLEWAESLYPAQPHDYYGSPSPLAFWYTDYDEMKLKPAGGAGQHADPACAWWSPLCVTIWRFTHDYSWIDKAAKFGTDSTAYAVNANYSMLRRGVLAIPRALSDK